MLLTERSNWRIGAPVTRSDDLRRTYRISWLLSLVVPVALLAGLPRGASAQEDAIVAPSEFQREIETQTPTGGPEFEADAAQAQADRIEKTGSAPGLSPRAAGKIEEIVVSARKRAELIEDTPVAVTAISEALIRESGITRTNQVQQIVPNMTFLTTSSGNVAQVRIRGVGSSSTGIAFDPGVGIYLDGVYFARSQGSIFDVVDVEQIEVLRGPQGTLFGKNTVGGAMNITTVKPTEELEGFVFLRPGNYGRLNARAMVNIPVKAGWFEDKLFARLAYSTQNYGGHTYNFTRDEYLSNMNANTFLGSLRFIPIDDLTIDVSGNYVNTRMNGRGGECRYIFEAPLQGILPDIKSACDRTTPFETGSEIMQLVDIDNYGVWGIANWTVGDVGVVEDMLVKVISSWQGQDIRYRSDLDSTSVPGVNLSQAGPTLFDGQPGSANQIQQELQVNGSAWDGRINAVAGFFSYWDKANSGNTIAVPAVNGFTYTPIEVDNFTWALYGQATVDITDDLAVTAGIRYTSDQKNLSQTVITSSEETSGSGGATFESWTPAASITFRARDEWIDETPIEHLMTYFSYARGFKGGGLNGTLQLQEAIPDPFGPETLDNFELGLKTISFDRRLSVSIAAFYGIYDDIQVNSQRSFEDPDGNLIVQILTLNAAEATTKGVELELMSQPVEGLVVQGSLGLLDAKYDSFPNAVSNRTGDVIDRTGQTFDFSPAYQTFLSAQYSLPLDIGQSEWMQGWLTGRLQWAYRDHYTTMGPEIPQGIQRGYNLLGARLSWSFLDDRAQVALWGANLLDQAYFQDVVPIANTVGLVALWFEAPLTYGGELSYRF